MNPRHTTNDRARPGRNLYFIETMQTQQNQQTQVPDGIREDILKNAAERLRCAPADLEVRSITHFPKRPDDTFPPDWVGSVYDSTTGNFLGLFCNRYS